MIREFVNGICMALADSVPGVSGGTIAFIMGFYDKFIGSIHNIVFKKGAERKEAIIYLAKLGTGWAAGMIAAILVLSSAFESHIYTVSSLFIGFILAAIPLIVSEEKEVLRKRYVWVIFALVGAALVIGITFLTKSNGAVGIDLTKLTIPFMVYLFIAGMISISAMFLPGISGSTLLLIFGLYLPIITGIKEILHFNLSTLPALIVFGLGVITGALTVVKGIKLCLDKYRTQTIYGILGLMIGSLYAIVMGPSTLKVPKEPLSLSSFNFIACFIGILIVFLIQYTGKMQKREEK